MKRFITLSILLFVTLLALQARPKGDLSQRHQVRVGWGDMLFETMAFHPSVTHDYVSPSALPGDFSILERHSYRYTGHLFAEYQFRATRVVRVGGLLDFEGIFWKESEFDSNHVQRGATVPIRNYNVVVMPTVRFDYLNREWWSLYSGLGAGALFAFDNQGGSAYSPALNLNFLGVQVGKGHWSGGLELGLMAALSSGYKIYMLGSRLVSVSLNYRW